MPNKTEVARRTVMVLVAVTIEAPLEVINDNEILDQVGYNMDYDFTYDDGEMSIASTEIREFNAP